MRLVTMKPPKMLIEAMIRARKPNSLASTEPEATSATPVASAPTITFSAKLIEPNGRDVWNVLTSPARATASGGGPVDAAFKAIESVVNSGTTLQLYSVNNITSGTDSQGEVTVRLEKGGRIVNGQGADTDIVIASAKAYINGLNKILEPAQRQHPQQVQL